MGRGWFQDVSSPAGDGVLEVTRWTGWYRGAIEAVPKPYRESYLLRGGKSGTWEGKISGPKPGGFGTAAGKPGDHDDPHGWPRQQMPYRGLFPGWDPTTKGVPGTPHPVADRTGSVHICRGQENQPPLSGGPHFASNLTFLKREVKKGPRRGQGDAGNLTPYGACEESVFSQWGAPGPRC